MSHPILSVPVNPTFIYLFLRPYVKGWLPRQHQSVLSVDDKTLVKALYPPPHATHQWADPLATPDLLEEDDEDDEESEDDEDDSELFNF